MLSLVKQQETADKAKAAAARERTMRIMVIRMWFL